jgi:hypothetical protein
MTVMLAVATKADLLHNIDVKTRLTATSKKNENFDFLPVYYVD